MLGLVPGAEPVSAVKPIRRRLRCTEAVRTAERRPVVLAVEQAGTALVAAVRSRCTAAGPERSEAAGRPGTAAGRPELDPGTTVWLTSTAESCTAI